MRVERDVIVFSGDQSACHGTGERGREWQVERTLTGWRLLFRDPHDSSWTYAGTHPTFQKACTEAGR
jgi:hypothetical protein